MTWKIKMLTGVIMAVFQMTMTVSSENILFLLPIASPSHVHVFEPLIRALGERGHNIVSLSPMNSSNMPKTVKQIQLISVDEVHQNMPNLFEIRKRTLFSNLFDLSWKDPRKEACLKVLNHPKLHLLLSNEKFDLVIVDIFLNYCVLGLIPHFQANSIFVTTTPATSYISNLVGNRLPGSFVPFKQSPYSDKMSLFEKLGNVLAHLRDYLFTDQVLVRQGEAMYREHLPNGTSLPGIHQIMGNVSMIFMNSHFALNYPRPLLPDEIEIGGIHIRPATKLPEDLDKFVSGSGEHGFILFSLGSVVKPSEMPEETRKVFLSVFSRLKQRVLWKWDNTSIPMKDESPNVLLCSWLPQQDVLGHPNIKLFITHGGLLSTQESVYHGVPILGLPVFSDQDLNVRKAEQDGYAKSLEIVHLNEDKLEKAILELIHDPKYTQNVKRLSKLVRDVKKSPLGVALYWVEYVLRYKGAVHLRSAARDLNFIQCYLLDVTALVLVASLLTLYFTMKCFKAIWIWVWGLLENLMKVKKV